MAGQALEMAHRLVSGLEGLSEEAGRDGTREGILIPLGQAAAQDFLKTCGEALAEPRLACHDMLSGVKNLVISSRCDPSFRSGWQHNIVLRQLLVTACTSVHPVRRDA